MTYTRFHYWKTRACAISRRTARCVALPIVPVGPYAVPPKKGDEDLARPLVRHREAVLAGRVLFLPELQSLENAVPGTLGRDLLALGGRTGEESFDQSQLVDEPGFAHYIPYLAET